MLNLVVSQLNVIGRRLLDRLCFMLIGQNLNLSFQMVCSSPLVEKAGGHENNNKD
jgi:hypothetical protein